MKLQQIVIPVAVLAGLIGLGLYVDHKRTEKQSLISGVFESQPTQVASRQSGRVATIHVREGESVRKGQLLVELEAQSDALQLEALRASARQAEAKSDEIRRGSRPEEIEQQAARVAESQAALDRVIRGARPQELAEASARVRQAEAKLSQMRKGPRTEEVQVAEADARRAESAYRASLRGPTVEERAQLQARLDTVRAQEAYAVREAERTAILAAEGAIAGRVADSARAEAAAATGRRKDAEEALARALRGTPPEELNQARQAFESARAHLALVRAGARPEEIRVAENDVTIARQSLNLLRSGSREEDIRAARAVLAGQQALLRQLQRGQRKEAIVQAEAAARVAELNAKSEDAKLKESKIVAPVDGVVDRILVATGDLISSGNGVVRMDLPQDIWLRVYVPEKILAQVKQGDPVSLSIDGVKDLVPAVVENIASTGEFTPANLQTPEERGRQVFAVRIRLRKPDALIKAGMSATVKRMGVWP